ncbi:hypothetical protein BpHYR1_009524 [Brachionus plicatilis]|uniref:Uncharacterized protein n=1 Tax=Brachionus plicatilis TaxID=10195 RepID=A0A3M7STY6_BRAPC|nr:hypothetical protein BpHYR1_009524 [Brachionus plicatilis]
MIISDSQIIDNRRSEITKALFLIFKSKIWDDIEINDFIKTIKLSSFKILILEIIKKCVIL